MALLNDLKGKLSQASQTTVNKVKDLSEVARLNGEISDAQGKIGELYGKIGFEVYKARQEGGEPELDGLMEQVKQLHQKIAENNELIQAINAVNTCPQCGAKIKKGMAFCSSCGYKLPVQEPPAPETGAGFCGHCGAPLVPGTRFCPSCGAKLE